MLRPKKAAPAKPPKPTKLTPQQEHFARLVVRGYSQSEAYRRSHNPKPGILPSSVWESASKIANSPKVATRIAALTEQAARAAQVTRESMLVEMAENRALALDAGELGVATTSSRDRARVAGLLKDRLELTGRDGAAIAVEQEVSIDERSSYELARRIAFALQLGRKRTKSAPKDEA